MIKFLFAVIYCALALVILGVLYLLAIMPRVFHKPDLSIFRHKLFAHRGLHNNAGEAPENSMEAFRRAVEKGFGIELDVQLSKDGIPVVFHDFTLQRVCGVKGKVNQFTYAQLQQFSLLHSTEKIPKFQEVLQVVSGKVPLIIELKIERFNTALCPAVDQMLRQYQGEYCIESFNPRGLRWYKKNHPQVVRGQLSQIFGRHRKKGNLQVDIVLWVLGNLLLNFLTRPDFIAYDWNDYPALSRRLCRRLYHNESVAWTIRSQNQLEKMSREFDVFIFESFIPEKASA